MTKYTKPPTPGDVIITISRFLDGGLRHYIYEVEEVHITPIGWKILTTPGSGYSFCGNIDHITFESYDVQSIPHCEWYKAIESFPEVFREYEKLNSV